MVKIHFLNVARIVLVFFLILTAEGASGQSRKVKKSIKNAERVEKREEKAYNKSREKAKKAHFKRQSDSTKEQLKLINKDAELKRKQNKDGVIEAFMRKRKNKKQKKKRSNQQKRR